MLVGHLVCATELSEEMLVTRLDDDLVVDVGYVLNQRDGIAKVIT